MKSKKSAGKRNNLLKKNQGVFSNVLFYPSDIY